MARSTHCIHWNCTRREAHALAALNHPHIAAIYDVMASSSVPTGSRST
jgi:hypothetical protein